MITDCGGTTLDFSIGINRETRRQSTGSKGSWAIQCVNSPGGRRGSFSVNQSDIIGGKFTCVDSEVVHFTFEISVIVPVGTAQVGFGSYLTDWRRLVIVRHTKVGSVKVKTITCGIGSSIVNGDGQVKPLL